MAPANLGRVVQAFDAIRNARLEKQRKWEAEEEALKADEGKLKQVMLHLLNVNGAQSIRTDHGTVYRTEKIKAGAADWAAIWTWMQANDAMDLLERRLKTTFIKEYMEAHDGAIPPGINVHREYEVTVRRPNTATKGVADGEG